MIKNIIFDIGSVLVDFIPEAAMQQIGIPEERIPALADATVNNPLWLELDRGVIPEDTIRAMMKDAAPELAADIDNFFSNAAGLLVRCFDYSAEWLKSYKELGYNIYLLSNYPVSYFDLHCRDKFPFIKYTDGRVVSGYVQRVKPDYEIYNILLKKYQLIAGECIFIDDRADNVNAACELGINGILFTDYDSAQQRITECITECADHI